MRKISLQSVDTTISLPAMNVATIAGTMFTCQSNHMQYKESTNANVSSRPFVMIIDDSATVRKIIETCLSREGFDVLGFRDGSEAIRWMTSQQGRIPELILLDIFLPTMNGYEIARYLQSQSRFCTIVIVIISRHDGILDRLKGRLVGAKAYLSKPFTTQQIISIVTLYLSAKHTSNKRDGKRTKQQLTNGNFP